MTGKRVLVTGAGGFIGGHLCRKLSDIGHEVYGVDIKYPEYRSVEECGIRGFMRTDLRQVEEVAQVFGYYEPEWVFALAADMGGMGFISNNDYSIMRNNLRINMNTIAVAHDRGVEKYFFSSSVCVYPEGLQMEGQGFVPKVTEDLAYPADPQDAYGWEKLTTENLLLSLHEDEGFPIYIGRFHNCFGPYSDWHSERAKAPAALCRKVAQAKLYRDPPYEIEVWGDGKQIRPFVHVDDLVEGILLLAGTDYHQPVNIGPTYPANTTNISGLVWTIIAMAGLGTEDISINYVEGPQGVRFRGASSELLHKLTGWYPATNLRQGIKNLYNWVERQVAEEQVGKEAR